MFKKGDTVKIKFSILEGVIVDAAIGDQANMLYLVEYTDHDGETQSRYFEVDQVQAA